MQTPMNQYHRPQPTNRHYQPPMIGPNILPKQNLYAMNVHRPNLLSPTSPIMLTPASHGLSESKPPRTRTHHPETNFHYNHNPCPTIHSPSLLHLRTHTILYCIRGHPNPHPNPHHTMRKPARTTKRWHLPSLLHTRQLPPPSHRHHPPPQPDWHPLPPHAQTIPPHNLILLIWPNLKPRTIHSLHGKSPPIRPTPMTAQSPRRGPNRWLNATSSPPPKTRGLRHHTNHPPSQPINKQPTLPLYHPSPMRSANN